MNLTSRFTFCMLAALLPAIALAMDAVPEVTFSSGNQVEGWKIYAAITGFAIGGMFSHYLKLWLMNEIKGSLWNYLFVDQPRATGLALFALAAAVGTSIAAGQFDGMTFKQLFLPAWLLGYASDTVNSGMPASRTTK